MQLHLFIILNVCLLGITSNRRMLIIVFFRHYYIFFFFNLKCDKYFGTESNNILLVHCVVRCKF